MRTRFIGVALTTLTLVMTAYGDAIFSLSNTTVDLETIFIDGQKGQTIFGTVRGTNVGNVSVIATSTRDTLVGESNEITSASGSMVCQGGRQCLHEVDLTWPGFGFPIIQINPFQPRNPDLFVTVFLCTLPPGSTACTSRTEQTFPPPGQLYGAGGNLRLTISTEKFETITEVKIESSGGFRSIQQIRAQTTNVEAGIPPVGVIPEPPSMLLLGSGLLLLTQALRRKLKLGFRTRSA